MRDSELTGLVPDGNAWHSHVLHLMLTVMRQFKVENSKSRQFKVRNLKSQIQSRKFKVDNPNPNPTLNCRDFELSGHRCQLMM